MFRTTSVRLPQVLESDPSLYFALQMQRLADLAAEGQLEEALRFAEADLSSVAESDVRAAGRALSALR